MTAELRNRRKETVPVVLWKPEADLNLSFLFQVLGAREDRNREK